MGGGHRQPRAQGISRCDILPREAGVGSIGDPSHTTWATRPAPVVSTMQPILRRRRTTAGLLLAAFAVAATGVPLAVPRLAANSVERYPCENCSCGCDSAVVCWTNCCCHSMRQRLVWAKKNGVRPPEESLRVARRQGYDVSPWVASQPVAGEGIACQPFEGVPQHASCCCSARKPAEFAEASQAAECPSDLPAWRALSCQGRLRTWLSVPATTLPDPADLALEAPWQATFALRDPLGAALSATPPTPPPERRV